MIALSLENAGLKCPLHWWLPFPSQVGVNFLNIGCRYPFGFPEFVEAPLKLGRQTQGARIIGGEKRKGKRAGSDCHTPTNQRKKSRPPHKQRKADTGAGGYRSNTCSGCVFALYQLQHTIAFWHLSASLQR